MLYRFLRYWKSFAYTKNRNQLKIRFGGCGLPDTLNKQQWQDTLVQNLKLPVNSENQSSVLIRR